MSLESPSCCKAEPPGCDPRGLGLGRAVGAWGWGCGQCSKAAVGMRYPGGASTWGPLQRWGAESTWRGAPASGTARGNASPNRSQTGRKQPVFPIRYSGVPGVTPCPLPVPQAGEQAGRGGRPAALRADRAPGAGAAGQREPLALPHCELQAGCPTLLPLPGTGGSRGLTEPPPPLSPGAVCGCRPGPQHPAGAALAPACRCRALPAAPCHPLPDGRPQPPDSPRPPARPQVGVRLPLCHSLTRTGLTPTPAVLSPHQGHPGPRGGRPGRRGEEGGAPGHPPPPPPGESPPAAAGVGRAGGGCHRLPLIPSSPCPGGERKGSREEEEEGEGEEEGPGAAEPGRGTGQSRRRG